MQHLKNFNWKKFLLQGVLPCLLAVAVGFISRYQLELSDGVTESFLQLQWPLYAPLNALTAFCLTLILFALLGKWSRATGISGAVFTLIALINYYTRDLHGSALMPQDILNLGTAAEVMGSYTLKITQDVVKIVLLYLPILAIVFVQAQLVKGAPKRAGWKARGVRAAGSALGVFLVMFFGYFGPVTIKPKTTYGWAWQNTYYTYGYLAGTIEATSLMADPVIEPENYNDAAAVNTARKADDYTAPASPESAEDYPDIVLILSESFYDFDLVTDLQADTDIMPVTKNLPNSVYGHTISPHVGGGTNSTEYEMLTSNSLILMPSITPFNWLNLYNANSVVSYLKGLGYSTMAAHPYTNSNYRRDSAWLALGFDETHFQSDFTTQETYGDRPYQTDSATYRDWETMYEAMPEDKPRFSFLVSIQSHGDYDMNDASLDIVHAATDYGDYDALMDEYLSWIKMTDAVIMGRILLRRREAVALLGVHVQKDGTVFHGSRHFKVMAQGRDIVPVHRTDIGETESLEEHARGKEGLETVLAALGQRRQIAADARDGAQEGQHVLARLPEPAPRQVAREEAGNGTHVGGDGHFVVVEHHDEALAEMPGEIQALKGLASGQRAIADDSDDVVVEPLEIAGRGHAESR